jgi:hypothetical protein
MDENAGTVVDVIWTALPDGGVAVTTTFRALRKPA